MKFQHFWLLIAILKQCLSDIPITQTQKYNFPLEIRNSNTIFLRDYTFKIIEAPFYELLSSSEFNLTIDQAISQIFKMNSSSINDSSIRIGSNYISLTGVNSNIFWVLTQNDKLYKGRIQSNGELYMNFLDIMIQKQYFQINLITNDFGMLSSLQDGELYFTLINSTNLECTDFIINYQIESQFYNPIIQILSINNTQFTFCLIYTTPKNAHIVYFTYNQDDIEQTSEQIFDGSYSNAFLSDYQNYLFLINSEHVYLVDLFQNSSSIQEIFNSNIQIQDDSQPISYFTTFQISNNLFHIIILQQQLLKSFFIDTNYINIQAQSNSYILNKYQKINKIELTLDNILIVTDTFIIDLQLKDSIKATGYQLLQFGTYAFFNLLRNIVVVQEFFNNQTIISTYLINQPQIFISQDTSKLLEEMSQTVKLDIQVKSQLNNKFMQYTFQIQLIQLNVMENSNPIQFHQDIEDLILQFPQDKVIDRNQIFLGPNLTLSLQSSNSDYLYASVEELKFEERSIKNAIYSIVCSFSRQQELYCSQFMNDTIILTIENPAYSTQKYNIQSYLKLQKCSCIKTAQNINVLMQFNSSVLIQQFDYSLQPTKQILLPFQMKIISAQILKDVLFTTTVDGKLIATDIYEKQQLFIISNYNFQEIYINPYDFPHYLFIDNIDELIILAYNGKQSYEFINSIQYPIQNYKSNAIGILSNGIYLAFCQDNNNFIYFYQKINIYLQNSLSNYFDVYFQGLEIYQNPNILSTYTSSNFYLIFVQGNFFQLCQFSGTGTSYTALRTSLLYQLNGLSFIQMSSIQNQEPGYQVQKVYLFTNKQKFIDHPYLSYDFILATRYNEDDYIGKINITYGAQNKNFSSFFIQNVSIIYENYLLLPRNLHDKQIYSIQNKGDIKINPRTLFYGNIQNYTVNCDQCNSFNIIQPIAFSNSQSINISVENMLNQNDILYLTDQQNNLYQFYPETNNLSMIYNLTDQGNQVCYFLFIEMQNSFPVQICTGNSTIIYAFNTSSNQIIQHNFTEVCCFYYSTYQNGILTVFSNGQFQTLDFFVFYFWISNNQINLMQIFNSNGVCQNCLISSLYLNMSQNFTTQPCQIFGFITTSSNGRGNNEIFLLKHCISSTMSQIFGFAPNQTTQSGNIYFQSSTWNLIQTELVSFPFYKITRQFGSSEYISDNLIQVRFIVTYVNVVDLYIILFNQTTGKLISFVLDQGFYIDSNQTIRSFLVYLGSNGLVMIQSFQDQNILTPQIYTFEKHKFQIKYNTKKLNRMIGFEIIQDQPSQIYSLFSGNYYAIRNKTNSQLYYIQNYLTLSIDLTGIQNTSIEITGHNPQNQIKQSLFILNLNYSNTNTNNNTIIPDNPNSTDPDVQKNQYHVVLILLYFFMIIFSIIVFIAPRCCSKLTKPYKQPSINFELIEK
ncbi:unnamed protein product [Paramecium primaurelia]|uniref:Transmembrane protein n=1 Tax=Paramecium primaurelia TaxID=5886 RepID=A0A8S1NPN2_PARPR|nr:unnamed protein product [Paramecium primaurelia]